jgi:uncharacterized protein
MGGADQLEVHRSISEIPRRAWDALVGEQGRPFLDHRWLDLLERSHSADASTGWRPFHLALWRGPELVAAAPAYMKAHSYGEFVYDFGWAAAAERLGVAYYPKLVIGVPFTPATGPRLLYRPGDEQAAHALVEGAITRARAEGCSSVHVLFCTAEEAQGLLALGLATRLGVQYHWRNRGYRSFEDFLARFRAKRRAQLRRERREVAAQGVVLRTLRGAQVAELGTDALHALYCSTVDKYLWGRRHLTPEFFSGLCAELPEHLELVEARRGGALVGGALNLTGPGVGYGRYWGALEEVPFLHFEACLYQPVEQAIEQGVACFQPGAGGEHKLVRGFEPTLTYSAHQIFHPALDRGVRRFLEEERAAILEGLPRWQEESGLRTVS